MKATELYFRVAQKDDSVPTYFTVRGPSRDCSAFSCSSALSSSCGATRCIDAKNANMSYFFVLEKRQTEHQLKIILLSFSLKNLSRTTLHVVDIRVKKAGKLT